MTVREAIDQAKKMKPNDYSDDTIMVWVNEVEQLIQDKVYHISLDRLASYSLPQNDNTELLVPAPYDKLYRLYLAAQIDLFHGEYTSYANTSKAANEAISDYHAWYMRNCHKCWQDNCGRGDGK